MFGFEFFDGEVRLQIRLIKFQAMYLYSTVDHHDLIIILWHKLTVKLIFREAQLHLWKFEKL